MTPSNLQCHFSLCACFLAVLLPSAAFSQLEYEAPRASPAIDGVVTEGERSAQLAIPMSWPGIVTPPRRGALLLGAPPSENELSGVSYVSWDDDFIYFAAEVLDDTPAFLIDSQGKGNVPYNAQDLWQPCFNPNADPFNLFIDPNGPPGSAAIYDVVVDTSDGFGPDVYRHGPRLSAGQHADIEVDGEVTADGYTLEVAVPWSTAMDDPTYVPEAGTSFFSAETLRRHRSRIAAETEWARTSTARLSDRVTDTAAVADHGNARRRSPGRGKKNRSRLSSMCRGSSGAERAYLAAAPLGRALGVHGRERRRWRDSAGERPSGARASARAGGPERDLDPAPVRPEARAVDELKSRSPRGARRVSGHEEPGGDST